MNAETRRQSNGAALLTHPTQQRLAELGRQLRQAFIRSLYDDPFADLLAHADEPAYRCSGESLQQTSDPSAC